MKPTDYEEIVDAIARHRVKETLPSFERACERARAGEVDVIMLTVDAFAEPGGADLMWAALRHAYATGVTIMMVPRT